MQTVVAHLRLCLLATVRTSMQSLQVACGMSAGQRLPEQGNRRRLPAGRAASSLTHPRRCRNLLASLNAMFSTGGAKMHGLTRVQCQVVPA